MLHGLPEVMPGTLSNRTALSSLCSPFPPLTRLQGLRTLGPQLILMRWVPSMILSALLLTLVPARSAETGPVTVNGIAVKVNDTIITLREIDDEIDESSRRLMQLRYGRQPEQLQQQMEKLQADTVEALVERQLILDEFKIAGYKLTE